MSYVDVAVLAVPTANKDAYLAHAKTMAVLFKECGALNYSECWGIEVPDGEVTSFIKAVQCQPDETVVVSRVGWPSKDIRDEGMPKAMSDPRARMDAMPFDGKRMIFGGFDVLVEV